MDEKIERLKEWIEGSENIVFFGGAGVSTESGIPDFRRDDYKKSSSFYLSFLQITPIFNAHFIIKEMP